MLNVNSFLLRVLYRLVCLKLFYQVNFLIAYRYCKVTTTC